MIQLDTFKRLLALADVARDPFTVAEAAAAFLAAAPADPTGRVVYARALATLGLGAAARRAADGLPEAAQIAGAVTPWASRRRRFQANLTALAENPHGTVDVAALAAAWDQAAARYELHLAADGQAFVLDTTLPLPRGWLATLGPHKAAAAAWQFDRAKNGMILPFAFDGVGLGWLLPRVFAQTANTFLSYSCAIHVVEPDPVALALVMHIHDLQDVLRSPRVHVYAGPGAGEAFEKTLLDATLTVPGQVIAQPLTARPPANLQAACERVNAARAARRDQLKAEIGAYYGLKTAADWSERLANTAASLRVLGLTTRYSTVLRYSMEEMRQAALSLGVDFRVVIEPDDSSLENGLLDTLASFKPDVLFQISRMRYENPHLPTNVPYVCWDQDNLPCMRTPEATASLNALTHVAGHGAVFGYGHLNWRAENCVFFHPAGATVRYAADPAPADLLAKHACDVSFVSNASETPEALAARQAQRWGSDPALAALFAKTSAEVMAGARTGTVWDLLPLQNLVRAAAGTMEERFIHEMAMDLKVLADRLFRHAALEWVAAWCAASGKTLRLYGAGWDRHATLARHAAGPAAQGDELRAIYQASRINLQLTENGFIHSRALDGLAAGGFFLNRLSPADGQDAATAREIHLLGKWVIDHDVALPAQIAQAADPDVRRRWALTLAHHPWPPEHAVKVLRVWGAMPMPTVAFPQLADVSFRTAEEFGALATKYLADEALRRSTAAAMRQVVLSDFSYAARWTAILAHLRRQLAAAGAAPKRTTTPVLLEV